MLGHAVRLAGVHLVVGTVSGHLFSAISCSSAVRATASAVKCLVEVVYACARTVLLLVRTVLCHAFALHRSTACLPATPACSLSFSVVYLSN